MIRTLFLMTAVAATAAVRADEPKPAEPAAYSDADFLTRAACGCSLEIEAANLAVLNAKSEAVRKYAQTMLDEHAKSKEKMTEAAEKAGVKLPTEPTAEHRKCIDKLKGLKAEEFDKEYLAGNIKGHELAVKECKRAKAESKDDAVKGFAAKALPMLEKHLDIAKKIQADGK